MSLLDYETSKLSSLMLVFFKFSMDCNHNGVQTVLSMKLQENIVSNEALLSFIFSLLGCFLLSSILVANRKQYGGCTYIN